MVTGSWNLTDQDAVDELVHLFELDERFGGDCQHLGMGQYLLIPFLGG